jgi:uncharacterized protein (DUF2147 family)
MTDNRTPVLFEGDVPTYAIDTVSERVAKVNKRAIRRGFPTVSMTVGETRMVSDPYFEHTAMCNAGILPCEETIPTVEYSTLTITASAPLRMTGWRLSGVVSAEAFEADGTPVVTIADVPGETNRDLDIADAMLCQHCNSRRYRTETFVLRHDDGRVMQVGRQCIRDFLGHDPAALLAGLDAFRSLVLGEDERESWGHAAPRTWSVSDIIHAAARIVAAEGWYVSRAKVEQQGEDGTLVSTSSRVLNVLAPFNKQEQEHVDAEYPANEKAEALATATIEALNALNPRNEWEYKLADYAKVATVTARHIGILASATILGLRAQEREQKATAEKVTRAASGAVDAYIGTVGAKVSVERAVVTFVREFEGNYGITTLVKFDTEQGAVQWWKSGYADFEAGQTYALTGTVKGHEVDRFSQRPTTTLTRCKVVAL